MNESEVYTTSISAQMLIVDVLRGLSSLASIRISVW
jgi:hypothetical protein